MYIKIKNKWLIVMMQTALVSTACGSSAQEVSPLLPVMNYAKPNILGNTILNRTEPVGSKPKLKLSDCSRLHNLEKDGVAQTSIMGDDVRVVDRILAAASRDHGYQIFKFMPEEVMWWVRISGSISIQSLGTAIHEANHAVDALLTKCNNGFATYFLDSHIIKTDHRFGDSKKYSIVAEALPSNLKTSYVGSRFSQYIEKNGSQDGSDFSILIDEFVAYSGAASLDISIIRSKEHSWLVNREITGLDVNPGGVADFMIYTLSYLKALRENYPQAYSRLQQQRKTLALLQTIWTAAEKTIMSTYDLTRNANKGGILIVSRDAIAATYSDEFIGELDRLGITHMSMNSLSSSYLNASK